MAPETARQVPGVRSLRRGLQGWWDSGRLGKDWSPVGKGRGVPRVFRFPHRQLTREVVLLGFSFSFLFFGWGTEPRTLVLSCAPSPPFIFYFAESPGQAPSMPRRPGSCRFTAAAASETGSGAPSVVSSDSTADRWPQRCLPATLGQGGVTPRPPPSARAGRPAKVSVLPEEGWASPVSCPLSPAPRVYHSLRLPGSGGFLQGSRVPGHGPWGDTGRNDWQPQQDLGTGVGISIMVPGWWKLWLLLLLHPGHPVSRGTPRSLPPVLSPFAPSWAG